MDEYGFQGVDIDWEYPGTDVRGGKREDIANFVLLMKEMGAEYGSNY
jgi:chitinase